MTKREWTPETGAKYSLRTNSDYCRFGLSNWHWFVVDSITHWRDGDIAAIRNINTDETATIPVSAIPVPIGWKPKYTITVTKDKLAEVLTWFARGITVRQSHYMPDCQTAFQPMDNDGVHHWKFAGDTVVDRIQPEQCDDVFAISVLETEYDVGVPAPCGYCVAGKRTRENSPVLVGQDNATCAHCGAVAGFSFDKPYHPKGYRYGYVEGIEMDDSQCANVRPAAECWACNGTGISKRYLSGMSRKERNKVIAQMHAEGWKVAYLRRGEASWVRERETVVKQFGQPAKTVKVVVA